MQTFSDEAYSRPQGHDDGVIENECHPEVGADSRKAHETNRNLGGYAYSSWQRSGLGSAGFALRTRIGTSRYSSATLLTVRHLIFPNK